MSVIQKIVASEVIDSRGYPTIEGTLFLDNNNFVKTSVPSGFPSGKYDAVELRDSDPKRFHGFGVTTAISYINTLISPKLAGANPFKQQEIDSWLIKADKTKNKSRLGVNTILLVSQLVAKAAAKDQNISLYQYLNHLLLKHHKLEVKLEKIPTPIFALINGGKHANNNLDFQEFQVIPSSSYSYSDGLQVGVEIYHELKNMLQYRNATIAVGEEGGFTPNFASNRDALEILKETIIKINKKIGIDIFLGLNIAATHFYKDQRYIIHDRPNPLKIEEYYKELTKIISEYSLLVVEDPFSQESWNDWKKLNSEISDQAYLVGNDLLESNKERINTAIKEKACSSIVIKPNQVGTISEVLSLIDLAKKNKLSYIFSDRSGETNDAFVADFAVAMQADFVKFGAPCRGERVAKYNRLWEIEKEGII